MLKGLTVTDTMPVLNEVGSLDCLQDVPWLEDLYQGHVPAEK